MLRLVTSINLCQVDKEFDDHGNVYLRQRRSTRGLLNGLDSRYESRLQLLLVCNIHGSKERKKDVEDLTQTNVFIRQRVEQEV
jgi:hypothetical protein